MSSFKPFTDKEIHALESIQESEFYPGRWIATCNALRARARALEAERDVALQRAENCELNRKLDGHDLNMQDLAVSPLLQERDAYAAELAACVRALRTEAKCLCVSTAGTPMLVSPCCNAYVYIAGDGLTHWYACVECEKPCDPVSKDPG